MSNHPGRKTLIVMSNDEDPIQLDGPLLQPKCRDHKCDQLQDRKRNLS